MHQKRPDCVLCARAVRTVNALPMESNLPRTSMRDGVKRAAGQGGWVCVACEEL